MKPLAHATSDLTFGTQFPWPSVTYPLGHEGVSSVIWVTIVTGSQPPAPSLSNPVTQIFGTSDVTQFPFPSNLYPAGHDGDRIGYGATQFPFPSLWYPEAQVETGIDGLTEVDGFD